jgi:glutaconate CoA-transferase subunit B
MPDSPVDLGCSTEELLAVLMSREVRDWETSACGAVSMIPAAALLLAEALHAPHAEIIILGSEQLSQNLGKDVHFLTQRGELDLFFHSAVQFDAEGNFNLHALGDPDAPERRLPGGYGSGLMSYMANRVLFFRTEHSKRTFVEKVDFVSGAAVTDDRIRRSNEPFKVFTTMAVMRFDRDVARYTLESAHPGFSAADVQAETGFELVIPDPEPVTPPPTEEELHTLRTEVRERMIETGTYPDWADAVLKAPA